MPLASVPSVASEPVRAVLLARNEERMERWCVKALVVVLLIAGSARAQETTTGSIAGRVVDAQALALPGATVSVTTPQGPLTFVTDAEGRFFAPFLTPGRYALDVTLS